MKMNAALKESPITHEVHASIEGIDTNKTNPAHFHLL